MLKFIDHISAAKAPERYLDVEVDLAAVVRSWRLSVFSFEWLDAEGRIKPMGALKDGDQARRKDVEALYKAGGELEKPVLGLGMQDHVEIGAGKAALLTLAALGVETMPVHIPKSNEADFKAFIAKS